MNESQYVETKRCPSCGMNKPLDHVCEPELFTMVRKGDESKVSGTGRILDGIRFHNGQVVICWRTDVEGAKHGHTSLGVYLSWEAFEFIHIKSHPTNDTEIEWL